MPGFCRTEKN